MLEKKVVAITVTFNSHDYLKKCLTYLDRQTYPIYKIIVVDNNSNLENYSKNQSLINDKIHYLKLTKNLGGAGGFEKGTEIATKYNPDFIWIMDDDAFPEPTCLETLISFNEKTGYKVLCPAIFGFELNEFQSYHHKKITNFWLSEKKLYNYYKDYPDYFEIDANAFVGPLISIEVIKSVGLPNGGLFIYGDDTEYTYRCSRKYKTVVIKDAIINHRDVYNSTSIFNPKNSWKDYYLFRNRLLFCKKYSKNSVQRLCVTIKIIFSVYLKMINTLINPKFKKYKKLRLSLLHRAIKDGTKNVYGKIIDPQEFINKIQKNGD